MKDKTSERPDLSKWGRPPKPRVRVPRNGRIEGLTRREWRERYREQGLDEREASFVVAITFGDSSGCLVHIDDDEPSQKGEAQTEADPDPRQQS